MEVKKEDTKKSIIERSVYQLVADFYIGKTIEFFVEERHFDDRIIRVPESDGRTTKMTPKVIQYFDGRIEFKAIDVKIEDKIIKIERHGYNWHLRTLEGYLLIRRDDQTIKIVNV